MSIKYVASSKSCMAGIAPVRVKTYLPQKDLKKISDYLGHCHHVFNHINHLNVNPNTSVYTA